MEGESLLQPRSSNIHNCSVSTHCRFAARLLPAILIVPLLGACTGGFGSRPGPAEIIWVGQPPPYGVGYLGPSPIAAAYTRPVRPPADNRDQVWPSSSIPRQRENDGDAAAPPANPALSAGSERKPSTPAGSTAVPSRAQPRPRANGEADATPRSSTCGYWRFGCGILWP